MIKIPKSSIIIPNLAQGKLFMKKNEGNSPFYSIFEVEKLGQNLGNSLIKRRNSTERYVILTYFVCLYFELIAQVYCNETVVIGR